MTLFSYFPFYIRNRNNKRDTKCLSWCEKKQNEVTINAEVVTFSVKKGAEDKKDVERVTQKIRND